MIIIIIIINIIIICYYCFYRYNFELSFKLVMLGSRFILVHRFQWLHDLDCEALGYNIVT